jgi:hypothetical protein
VAKPGRKPKQTTQAHSNFPPRSASAAPATQDRSPPAHAGSISGYFRGVFEERPDLLDARSNAELIARWLRDHPDALGVPNNVKAILTNIKSVLRRRRGQEGGGRGTVELPAEMTPQATRGPNAGLLSLEESIDNSLSIAKKLNRPGLEGVIRLLRRARNEVVWEMGQ